MNDDNAFLELTSEFKGQELSPWTEKTRLLYLGVMEDGNSVYSCYALVFLLLKYHAAPKEAVNLAFNREAFRDAVLDWAETFEDGDRDECITLASSILESGAKGKVEAMPGGNAPSLGESHFPEEPPA